MRGWWLTPVRGATLVYAAAAFYSVLAVLYFALGVYPLSELPDQDALFGIPLAPGRGALVASAVLAALIVAGLLTAARESARPAPASLAVAGSFLLFALNVAGYQQHRLAGRLSLFAAILSALPSLVLVLWTWIEAERKVRLFSRTGDWVDRTALALRRRGLFGRSMAFWLISALGIAVAIGFVSVALNQYWNLQPGFDTARFQNIFWHTLRGRIGWESLDRVNYLGVHFSPTMYLLLPVYALYQHAATLLVLQSLMLAAGAIPLWLLAKRITGSIRAACAFCVAYLFFPHVIGIDIYGFSDLSLWPAIGFTYLLLLERPHFQRSPWYWLLLILALGVKEEIAVTLAAISAVQWAQGRDRPFHAAAVAACALWFIAATQAVMPALLGPGAHPDLGKESLFATYYEDMLPEGTSGAFAFAANAFLHPLLAAETLARPQVLKFLADISLPLLFLPLFSGLRMVSLLPNLVLVNLLATYRPPSSTLSPYIAYIVPWFYCALYGWVRVRDGFPRLTETAKKGLLYSMMLLSVLLLTRHVQIARPVRPDTDAFREWLEERPAGLSVMASRCFVPLLSNRDRVRAMNAEEDLTKIDLIIVQSRQQYCTWTADHYEAVRAAVLATRDFVTDPSPHDGIVVFRRVRASRAPAADHRSARPLGSSFAHDRAEGWASLTSTSKIRHAGLRGPNPWRPHRMRVARSGL